MGRSHDKNSNKFRSVMRWPWQSPQSNDALVVSWADLSFAYVQASLQIDGSYAILRFGVEHQGDASDEEFLRRLHDLGLKGLQASCMLRPHQYQLQQIDAPMVPNAELRSAARWKILEITGGSADDITLDVMRVGDESARSKGQLFAVVASQAVVQEALRLGQAMQWKLRVIDIQETAQRNLQSALARREGRLERADAALVIVDERQALLTISANEELFEVRRIDLGEGFMSASWNQAASVQAAPQDLMAEVPEYVPGRVTASAQDGDDLTQRVVVELQRSFDVWDRTWTQLPLEGLRVQAGERSEELANWLSRELRMNVGVLDMAALFPGFEGGTVQEQRLCWPLLGALLRTESSKS